MLNSIFENGIGTIVNSSAAPENCEKVLSLAKKYSMVYAAIGIHPNEVGKLTDKIFAKLKELATREKCENAI